MLKKKKISLPVAFHREKKINCTCFTASSTNTEEKNINLGRITGSSSIETLGNNSIIYLIHTFQIIK